MSGTASSSPVEIERDALAETLGCVKRFIVESLDSGDDGDTNEEIAENITRRLRTRYRTLRDRKARGAA